MSWKYEEVLQNTENLDTHLLQDDVPENEPLDFHDWTTFYSDHLLNMWNMLCEYRKTTASKNVLMCFSDYWDFCEFCYSKSVKHACHNVL